MGLIVDPMSKRDVAWLAAHIYILLRICRGVSYVGLFLIILHLDFLMFLLYRDFLMFIILNDFRMFLFDSDIMFISLEIPYIKSLLEI
jgi:hypothetical protein